MAILNFRLSKALLDRWSIRRKGRQQISLRCVASYQRTLFEISRDALVSRRRQPDLDERLLAATSDENEAEAGMQLQNRFAFPLINKITLLIRQFCKTILQRAA